MQAQFNNKQMNKRHSMFSTNVNFNNFIAMQAMNKPRPQPIESKQIKLRSNSIFAFQPGEETSEAFYQDTNDNNGSDLNNLTKSSLYSNQVDSNNYFFKGIHEEIPKKDSESDNSSISSDIEKNLNLKFLEELNTNEETDKIDIQSPQSEDYDEIETQNFKQPNYFKRGSIDHFKMNQNNNLMNNLLNLQQEMNCKNPNQFMKRNSVQFGNFNFIEAMNYLNQSDSFSNTGSVSPAISLSPNKRNMCNTSNSSANHAQNQQNIRPNQNFIDTNFIFNAINQNNNNFSNQTANNNNYFSQNNHMKNNNRNKRNSMDFASLSKNQFPFPLNNLQTKQIPNTESKQRPVQPSNSGKNFNQTKSLMQFNNINDDRCILDNIPAILRDQNGCRLVQKKLDEKNIDFINLFFAKIKPFLNDLTNDQFGNYVIQKFIEVVHGETEIITSFFEQIKDSIYNISINQYGTRVLQKALDFMLKNYDTTNAKINICLKRLILQDSYSLIQDTNGNHVFQKVLQIYPKSENQFIYDEILTNYLDLAMSKKGGCIYQKAFDCSQTHQLDALVYQVLKNIDELINHEYGNFIIQQIVLLKNKEYNNLIGEFVKRNIIVLSKKKFSSNVIDKCILMKEDGCGNILRNDIIDHLIETQAVSELIGDVYGNYVVQKALQVSNGNRFSAIITEIKSVLKNLKQTSFGRKILDNLMQNYGEYFQILNTNNSIAQNGAQSSYSSNGSNQQQNLNKVPIDNRRKSHIIPMSTFHNRLDN